MQKEKQYLCMKELIVRYKLTYFCRPHFAYLAGVSHYSGLLTILVELCEKSLIESVILLLLDSM